MADPKEHHTTALMSQILSRNIFTEEHFAVLTEQPPSPASRKSVDIVVSYFTNDREDLRILCICEYKRTKITQEWSLAALERQALDYSRICLKDTGVDFIYTATMAGCRMRLWKCEDGGDRYLFTPFWGTNTTGDWNEYIDVGGHHGDVEQITTAFNHMKGVPPTTRYGQTQESYGTQDFTPAAIYSENSIYDATAEHDNWYNAGQSSYTDPPPNAYDDESAAMDDGDNAG
jgi:hypothetical protein